MFCPRVKSEIFLQSVLYHHPVEILPAVAVITVFIVHSGTLYSSLASSKRTVNL